MGLISLLSCVGFLLISQGEAGLGFPLDDAWIHQTFARNFAATLTWSFQRGIPSGGSTGPLWGLILSLLHLWDVPIVLGTHLLGSLLLWGCSVTGYRIGKELFPGSKTAHLLTGSVIALEWHVVWAALSGMETILLMLIILNVFLWILQSRDDWWTPGILTGVSIWIRPDGITLIGPLILCLLFRKESPLRSLKDVVVYSGSLVLLIGPYFLFNHFVAGDVWPNTFYAKQTEYAVLRQAGLIPRYFNLAKQLVTGVGVILLPGFIVEAWDMFRRKDWGRAGILLWVIGYVGIYALRLPVVYQHGRYIMPVMPAFSLLGLAGLARWIKLKSQHRWKRVISAAWGGAAAAVLVVFWVLGARAYALDIGVIETEMVRVGRWISKNTPVDAVVGAHDIGGLGYFGEREIIDLAGLVSPDVIPFIRDQAQLASYLDEKGADYLVTFPSWYPEMVKDLPIIYQSKGDYSPLFGMDWMTVFEWESIGD